MFYSFHRIQHRLILIFFRFFFVFIQLTVSIIVLYTARAFGFIRFPHFSENVINKVRHSSFSHTKKNISFIRIDRLCHYHSFSSVIYSSVLLVLKPSGNFISPFSQLLFHLNRSSISLPMFTVLRRFSIWLTMIGEQIILRYRSSFRSLIELNIFFFILDKHNL